MFYFLGRDYIKAFIIIFQSLNARRHLSTFYIFSWETKNLISLEKIKGKNGTNSHHIQSVSRGITDCDISWDKKHIINS